MIAHIRGKLTQKHTDKIIVDVHGLGYLVFITLGTFYKLPQEGEEVFLHIHTHMRESSLELYGFSSQTEREMFRLLIGVTGCGPRLATNVLSGIRSEELAEAIAIGDTSRLVAVPGVGKRIAERLVMELRDKISLQLTSAKAEDLVKVKSSAIKVREEAVSALVNLGYSRKEAEKVVINTINDLRSNDSEPLILEEVIKIALRNRAEWLQQTR